MMHIELGQEGSNHGEYRLASPFKITGHLATDAGVMVVRLDAVLDAIDGIVSMWETFAADAERTSRDFALLGAELSQAGYLFRHIPAYDHDPVGFLREAHHFLVCILPDVLGWNAEALAVQVGKLN